MIGIGPEYHVVADSVVLSQGWKTPSGESALRPFHDTRQYADVSAGFGLLSSLALGKRLLRGGRAGYTRAHEGM